MAKALFIAEKNSLMRTIQDVYNRNRNKIPFDIDFLCQRGHLVRLKMPDEIDEQLKKWSWDTLPFHPDEHGGWEYTVIKEKRVGNFPTAAERFNAIERAIKSGQYDFVINAGDPEQEGELLIQLVLNKAGNTLPVKRFWSNNMTDENIIKTLQNLRDNNEPFFKNLLSAAYARQRSDYRFGLNLTRAATLKMGGTAAVGRVKTVMLNMVVQRENQIRNFNEEVVYGVKLHYGDDFQGSLFIPQEATENNKKEEGEEQEGGIVWFDTRKEAEDLIATLSDISTVANYSSKEERQKPPKLFKMVSAQSATGRAFGYEVDQIDRVLQELYEMKLLSYPRTDCEYIPSNENLEIIIEATKAHPELSPYASSIGPEDVQRVRKTKKWANDKEVDKAGHTALIPTGKSIAGIDLREDQLNIYTMIVKRFLAIFMPDLIQNKVEITTKNKEYFFRTTGKTLVDPGYTRIFNTNIQETNLPMVHTGQELSVLKKEVSEKKTMCPKRFTTTSLAEACDSPAKYLEDESLKRLGKELSIGTPATRTNIIKELIQRNKYIQNVKNGRRMELAPTETGEIIIENLKDFDITKVDMTGLWEEELIAVRNGELSLEEVEGRMKQRVNQAVEQFKQTNMKPISSSNPYQDIATCPICSGRLIEGPKGFFCSNLKEKGCKCGGFKNIYGAKISKDEFLAMLTGKKFEKNMSFKDKKTGKTSKWRQEVGVNKQGTITPIQKNVNTGWKCLACGKDIYESNRSYYCQGQKDKTCGVFASKNIGGRELPKEEFEQLFTTGQSGIIKDLKSNKKKGVTYNIRMTINPKEKKVDFNFVNEALPCEYSCPLCGQTLMKNGKKFTCSCGFNAFAMAGGRDLTEKEIERLFTKGETNYLTNLKKKDGGDMSPVKIVVDKAKKTTKFVFKPNY